MNDDVRDMTHVFLHYGKTNIHPVAAVFMLCMVGLVLSRRRSRTVLAVLLVCVFMPMMQRLVIAGLDFSMMRLILMLAWASIIVRGEYRGFKPGKIDWVFLLWTSSLAVFYVLRVGPSGIVYRLGTTFDALTVFFLFRILVRRPEGVALIARQLAWIMVVLSVFMLYEMATHINVFSVFGSAPLISTIRDGRVRCQGPFSHPILVGTFGAVLLPVFCALFLGRRKGRLLTAGAILATTAVTVASGSSGPFIAWGIGLMGWGLWPIRKRVRAILWAMVGMGFVIHVVREKPIWHLIGRIAGVTGGTGYHRYRLIDAFVSRFGEWALVGTSDTAHWGWGLQDTTNQYVAEGIDGGLLTLILFVVLLHSSFWQLRRTRQLVERAEGPKSPWGLLTWSFSVSLAAHCVSFISVTYFGQMEQFFFLFLAMIPSLSRFNRSGRPVANRRPTRSLVAAHPIGNRPSSVGESRRPSVRTPTISKNTV